MDPFILTQSRVVQVHVSPEALLSLPYPSPMSMWTLREHGPFEMPVWAVFESHQDAVHVLSHPTTAMSLSPAMESDLEPFSKLAKVNFPTYALSTNPPNARTTFRLGDWICSTPNCAAHNFGRNIACIGCGSQRAPSTPSSSTNSPTSPRFSLHQNAPHQYKPSPISSATLSPRPPHSAHPLLTPSGRAFAQGGRVQNVSSDPLAPCIMYWPDNEPFPEQGQIRPSGIVGVSQPPILNTGNRGPISHQPGDWICQKCNYLNWRRRKVCQTCLPYAEGNGDSISPAVQAERIALLTNVLTQTNISSSPPPQSRRLDSPFQVQQSHPHLHQQQIHPHLHQQQRMLLRSQSMTPPQVQRLAYPHHQQHPHHYQLPSPSAAQMHMHRAQSHLDLGARAIYQTPPPPPSSLPRSPMYSSPAHSPLLHVHAPAPAPLLPSFLLDSPTSTSSLSSLDDEYMPSSASSSPSSVSVNIWKVDGQESLLWNGSQERPSYSGKA